MPSLEYFPVAANMPAPPLSAAVRHGHLLFVSGTPGYYLDGSLDDEDFAKQFDQSVANLRQILARGGSSLRSVLKVNVLLTRNSDVGQMNARYAHAFGPEPYPARTTCVVAALPDPKMLIEIECVASVNRV